LVTLPTYIIILRYFWTIKRKEKAIVPTYIIILHSFRKKWRISQTFLAHTPPNPIYYVLFGKNEDQPKLFFEIYHHIYYTVFYLEK